MADMSAVPFLDLVAPHRELEQELTAVFQSVIRSANFIGGAMVEDFERDFAKFCDAKECVGVGSGTDALRFVLIAAGVGRGDMVLTVPNTFIATTEAITQAGARLEFVDVDERTYNIDPAKLQEYIAANCRFDESTGSLIHLKTGERVAAIIPVHLFGQMADMDPILELAERYKLKVIEDACQAHGAEYFSKKENRWRKAGSIGLAAAFSFYPGKNLGACGEAGAVTTNDEQIAQGVRRLRDHGQAQKYYHDTEGYNGRLDAIQAGFLRVKLAKLAEWTQQRREKAAYYNRLFQPLSDSLILPVEPAWSKAVYHLYVIRIPNREDLRLHLNEQHIGSGIHYPIPLHLQKAYQPAGYKEGDFPVAEKAAREMLSLPMYPQLRADQQDQVASAVKEFVTAKTKVTSLA